MIRSVNCDYAYPNGEACDQVPRHYLFVPQFMLNMDAPGDRLALVYTWLCNNHYDMLEPDDTRRHWVAHGGASK